MTVRPGPNAVNKVATKQQQLKLLEEASDACQQLRLQLRQGQSARTAAANTSDASSKIKAEVTALVNSLPMLRKMVENQEVRILLHAMTA